ncbi:plexin domain-containing protein 2-like [Argiope bruennichi]|uniref:Plexin domain-containing protein 2 n=1 Tax=Argiope bruennichi TaxID=94029 RepID=A0A8T0FIT5_ARGBR|nr:plexin domain-containing protein 2-like [Argiope bruennichi]KAF8789270.1 Plexin domain-containing protein 2 [Argiope bruennichi]
MYLTYRSFTLLVFLSAQFFRSECFDAKFEKNLKSSDLKQKLAKAEALRMEGSPESEKEQEETEPISVLGITVPPELINNTVVKDHHTYYNSTFYSNPNEGKQFWVDLDSPSSHANIHEMLSNSHRQATTVELSFDFPFYGHLLRNITIATGGFLYMGDYLHNWIAATQYVAPLMANFDTSQSPESVIKYADNGTAFTTEWKNVYIQDHMNDGSFTFQTTLLKNGDIVFAYKDIPYPIANISDVRHPVKIGISDAYILERSLFFVRRKTIYEYHRIDMLKRAVSNNTAIHFTALPTCPGYKDCNSCQAADPKMECSWCEALKRCSDGIDRERQNWISSGCVLKKDNTCPAESGLPIDHSTISDKGSLDKGITPKSFAKSTSKYGPSSPYNMDATYSVTDPSNNEIGGPAHYVQEEVNSSSGVSTGAIVTIVVFLAALIGAGLWVGYAYKFPQTPSGQFLIKYRPSQWTFKSKEDNNSVSSNSRHL